MGKTAELEQLPGLGWIRKGSKATIEYCLEYKVNGTTWSMNFFAENDDDAENKIESVRSSLRLLGRLDERIAWSPSGLSLLLRQSADASEL